MLKFLQIRTYPSMIDEFQVESPIQLHQIASNSILIFENPNFSSPKFYLIGGLYRGSMETN